MTGLISRKKAKEQGLNHYFTGKPCKRGHVEPRRTSSMHCIKCVCRAVRRYQKTEKGQLVTKAADVKYQASDSGQSVGKAARHKYRHSEKGLITARTNTVKRRAQKLNAQPSWVDEQAIKAIYEKCYELNRTSNRYVVDHYYSMLGKTVCGLHVPENLQIISTTENATKGNKHPEEFYCGS